MQASMCLRLLNALLYIANNQVLESRLFTPKP